MINCTAIHNYVITSAWNAELKLKKKSTFQNEPYRLGFVFYRSFPISKAASCCRTAPKTVKVTPWEFVSYACLAEKKCNLFTASSTMYFFSSQQATRTSMKQHILYSQNIGTCQPSHKLSSSLVSGGMLFQNQC